MKTSLLSILRHFSVIALAILAGTDSIHAQAPLPPTVIVNGTVFTGGSGSYSTANYGASGGGPASLYVDGSGTVSFSASQGYWQQPYLISAGYWVPGFTVPGYTIPGYWTDSYWVDTGNRGQATFSDSMSILFA